MRDIPRKARLFLLVQASSAKLILESFSINLIIKSSLAFSERAWRRFETLSRLGQSGRPFTWMRAISSWKKGLSVVLKEWFVDIKYWTIFSSMSLSMRGVLADGFVKNSLTVVGLIDSDSFCETLGALLQRLRWRVRVVVVAVPNAFGSVVLKSGWASNPRQ